MKKRISQWYNDRDKSIIYGIEVFHNGEWVNVMEGGKPLLFGSKESAKEKLKTI